MHAPRAACTVLITRDIEVVRQGICLRMKRPESAIKYLCHLPLGSSLVSRQNTCTVLHTRENLSFCHQDCRGTRCDVGSLFSVVRLEYVDSE
jgi:hypothetical protein